MTKSEYIFIKRRVIFSLSLLTVALFLGFVCIIGIAPGLLSGGTIIGLGFALIGFCIASVYIYGFWLERLDRKLEGLTDA